MADFDDLTELLNGALYVVTTAAGGHAAGCLVGFATQTSIDPPRFLIGLSNKNHTHRVALGAERLVVHVLGPESKDLARLFGETTGDDTDKFARCAWSATRDGVPVLDEAPAWFTGTIRSRVDAGDHTGFLVDIDDAQIRRRPERQLRLRDVADFEPGHDA